MQDYLAPLEEGQSCDKATLTKLELFSLKLFKLSLELAKKTAESAQEEAVECLFKLCQLTVSGLRVCGGSSGGKVPPMSFEKLLLHFVQLCVTRCEFAVVVETCRTLRERVCGGGEVGIGRGCDKVGDTLLKHAFDLAWKAALSLEQNTQEKQEEKESQKNVEMAELCLELREEAFACLLTVSETNAVFVVERVIRCSQRYHQIMSSVNTNVASNSTPCFERLYEFHSFLLSVRDFPSLLLLSREKDSVFLGVDYLCHVARVAHRAGHTHQAEEYISRTKTPLSGHRGGKLEKRESDCGTAALVNLTSAVICLEGQETSLEKRERVCANLAVSAREMERVDNSRLKSAQLTRLWETLELLFHVLRRWWSLAREKGVEPCSLVPRGAFPSLVSLVMSQVRVGGGSETGKFAGRGREVSVSIDCTREWIGNAVQNITVRSRDKIVRVARACILSSYGYSSVLSPEVDESMIQLPTLLLVVGAVSLPLKCEYFL